MFKVKAHNNDKNNDRADFLAKEGINNSYILKNQKLIRYLIIKWIINFLEIININEIYKYIYIIDSKEYKFQRILIENSFLYHNFNEIWL